MKNLIYLTCLSMFLAAGCASVKKIPKPQISQTAEKQTPPASEQIAKDILNNINLIQGKKIAVSDFSDIYGNDIEEGKILAEQLTTKLSQNQQITVIERRQLEKILAEQKLQMSGITEQDGQKIGQLLNVDVIISGTISHLASDEELNVRMVNVATGQIIYAYSIKQDMNMRKREFDALPAEWRQKIDSEFAYREQLRTPENVNERKEFLKLKDENPVKFREIVSTIRESELLKINRPRLFLYITEPENSPKLQFLEKRNKPLFDRMSNLRERLEEVFKYSPSYREKVMSDREIIIKMAPKGRDE